MTFDKNGRLMILVKSLSLNKCVQPELSQTMPLLLDQIHRLIIIRNYIDYNYSDVTMGVMAPHIPSLMSVYSMVHSEADQTKHQSSASLAFVRGIYRGPVNSPHKGPVTRKMFPFDDVIMWNIHKTLFSITMGFDHLCDYILVEWYSLRIHIQFRLTT